LFTGEKIGVGMGKTRKDAHQQAAENALHNLAGKTIYLIILHRRFLFLTDLILYYIYFSTIISFNI